jgi:hypothetical protein
LFCFHLFQILPCGALCAPNLPWRACPQRVLGIVRTFIISFVRFTCQARICGVNQHT